MRDCLRTTLEEEVDIEVISEADNGRDAVKKVLEMTPDIVLTDIAMHELNGIEATRQIKKENPNTKVIVLSMHSERQMVIGAFRAGASGYLLKNSSSSDLIEAIRIVHFGRKYLSQEISDIDILSNRESEILQLMSEGNAIKRIGKVLYISPKTVESHRANIMEKLDIHNIPELTKYAIRTGLTSLNY